MAPFDQILEYTIQLFNFGKMVPNKRLKKNSTPRLLKDRHAQKEEVDFLNLQVSASA